MKRHLQRLQDKSLQQLQWLPSLWMRFPSQSKKKSQNNHAWLIGSELAKDAIPPEATVNIRKIDTVEAKGVISKGEEKTRSVV